MKLENNLQYRVNLTNELHPNRYRGLSNRTTKLVKCQSIRRHVLYYGVIYLEVVWNIVTLRSGLSQ